MDRRQLEYLVAVVEHGGFTAASQALHVSQPSLSQAIKNLELELGVQLLQRLRCGTRLTSAGEALVPPARQALRSLESARMAVAGIGDVEGGHLDIVALPLLAADPLVGLITAFHARHPRVKIRVMDPQSRDVLDVVRSGEAELALMLDPPPTTGGYVTVPLPTEEIWLALPPGCPVHGGPPGEDPALADLPFIVSRGKTADATRILRAAGLSTHFVVECDHRDAILPLVLAGVGAAMVVGAVAEQAKTLGAVLRRMDPPVFRGAWLVHQVQPPPSPAACAFVRLAAEQRPAPEPHGTASTAVAI